MLNAKCWVFFVFVSYTKMRIWFVRSSFDKFYPVSDIEDLS